ncbi:DUF3152 domain-containing protein [Micromonospora sp. NPDC000089]|uniref:DUF3152 domain-containing protein n=1 Tax=unclassified Micromonospora TaxID=2617518 RepID=UPI0036858132
MDPVDPAVPDPDRFVPPGGAADSAAPRTDARRPVRVRLRRRRRRAALIGLVLLAGTATVVLVGTPERPPPASVTAPGGGGAGHRVATYPSSGPGRFTAAAGESPVQGADGPLRRYRVAVEQGTGQDADAFAAAVDETMGDERSWIASGRLRLQRVAEAAAADFTVYLATPATSERMCAQGGLSTDGYTSCRLPGQVIINLARWMEAVPDYGAPVATYRTYVINHEVGHELGELHQACPGPGEPAPVMQQQTYGLAGCVANAWPYLAGVRYEGEPVDGI